MQPRSLKFAHVIYFANDDKVSKFEGALDTARARRCYLKTWSIEAKKQERGEPQGREIA